MILGQRTTRQLACISAPHGIHTQQLAKRDHRRVPFLYTIQVQSADWMDKPSLIPQVALRLDQFKRARQRIQELMIKVQQSWVKHKDTPKYQEGDLVWLEGCHLRMNQPTAKLVPKRHGPFPIVQVMSPVNYQLELPTQWSIHDVFHINLLTPYQETNLHGSNYSRPAPDLINNEEEYEVEKILDSRQFGRGHKRQYLIKWKGYPTQIMSGWTRRTYTCPRR